MLRIVCLRFIYLIFTVSLVGCAAPAYVIEDSVTSGSQGAATVVIIDDQRPKTDAEHSIGSFMFTSDDYGVWTLGDKQFSPEMISLLQVRLLKNIALRSRQPARVNIKLNRLIIQANHQADMLNSASGMMTPLAVAIAESVKGQDFETDYVKNKPFAIGFIEADVTVVYADGGTFKKRLSLSKAENFSSHMDEAGRKAAATSVVRSLLDEFSRAIQ